MAQITIGKHTRKHAHKPHTHVRAHTHTHRPRVRAQEPHTDTHVGAHARALIFNSTGVVYFHLLEFNS